MNFIQINDNIRCIHLGCDQFRLFIVLSCVCYLFTQVWQVELQGFGFRDSRNDASIQCNIGISMNDEYDMKYYNMNLRVVRNQRRKYTHQNYTTNER